MKIVYPAIYALLLFTINICSITICHAQQIPIGSWKEYLAYGNPFNVVGSDNKVYCINSIGLFSVNKSDNSLERYSKVTGLSDIGYSKIAFDKTHQLLVIAYTNSNIDLLEGNTVINIPDIKRNNIVGDKNIYNIFVAGNYAYLSCGFGIVVVDLVKNEIHDTYYIAPGGAPARVNALTSDGQYFYAATTFGLYYAGINDPQLAYYASWTKAYGNLPVGGVSDVLYSNNQLYCTINNIVYAKKDTLWNKIYSPPASTINSLSPGINGVLVNINSATYGSKVTLLSSTGPTDSLINDLSNPYDTYQDGDNSFWVANFYNDLVHFNGKNNSSHFKPNGPANSKVNSIAINNHNVYVGSGTVNRWNATGDITGFYAKINDTWKSYNIFSDSRVGTDDFLASFNPKTGLAYIGSYGGGLIEYNDDYITNLYKQNNSSINFAEGDPSSYRVSGIAFDQDGNMWLSNFLAAKPICLRTQADGKWYSFLPNTPTAGGQITCSVVDQNNYKWFAIANGLGGILVYDSGADPTDPSDDQYKTLGLGVGNGNLPNLNVESLAVDHEGQIWVGTDQGVAVFYCPGSVFQPGGCDAQQILVKQDQYYNYLLVNEVINAIAIDGADRKWFATNDGVFLMSADGTKQIYYFNEDNSPLFSNTVTSVAIDNINGEVYLGTDKGLMVFRAGATEEGNTDCGPVVYPNPVRKEYQGPIAIKGLVSNSQVKITDVDGHLVYQTTALGTQAIWDGKTLKGYRASSGVYLVYASSPDGSQSCFTKLVLIN